VESESFPWVCRRATRSYELPLSASRFPRERRSLPILDAAAP